MGTQPDCGCAPLHISGECAEVTMVGEIHEGPMCSTQQECVVMR